MSAAALRLIRCRRLSTAGSSEMKKVLQWKDLSKLLHSGMDSQCTHLLPLLPCSNRSSLVGYLKKQTDLKYMGLCFLDNIFTVLFLILISSLTKFRTGCKSNQCGCLGVSYGICMKILIFDSFIDNF